MISISLLKDEAYAYLTKLINDGSIKYGEIYSLNNIAAELQMSRTPVRDAIQMLSDENRIDILPSRGFRLHRMTEDEILQLYHFSSAIEGYCAACLAEKYKSQGNCNDVAQLKALIEKMRISDLDHISFGEFYYIDNDFHRVIMASLGDSFFNSLIDSKKGFIDHPELHLTERSASKLDILQAHQRILDAICAGDPAAAFLALLSHAEIVYNSYKSAKAAAGSSDE